MKLLTTLVAGAALGLASAASAVEPVPLVDQIDEILVKHDGGELVPYQLSAEDRDAPEYFILYFSASW